MSIAHDHAQGLARAYSAALRGGDKDLSPTERALLTALVAESARTSRDYFATRHGDDPSAVGALDGLVAALNRTDLVGKGLAAAQKRAEAAAQEAVVSVVIKAAAPWWAVAGGLLLLGFLASAGSFGEVVGYAAFGLLVLVLGAPFALAHIARGGAAVASAAGKAGAGIWSAVSALHGTLDRLGAAAVGRFELIVVPALQEVFGASFPRPNAVAKVRRIAIGATVVSYALAFAAGIYFVRGFQAGLDKASDDTGGCIYNRFSGQWIPPGCNVDP